MGQYISKIYKYINSICPPCIEYYAIDVSSNILISDISSNVFVYDISMNVDLPIKVTHVEKLPERIEVTAEKLQERIEVPAELPSILPNPLAPKSLDKILTQKYHISHKKAVCLMEEFHSLHAILNLTVEQLAETKCNGRKFGSMGATIWKQLHV